MSSLKKDITQILANLYSQAYADGTVGHSRSANILTAHKEIINLIEKSEQKLLAKMTLDCKTVDYQGEQWNAILVKKLKNITFEQDEDIPNGAWGKNSLKKTIREIVEDCAEDYYPYHEFTGAYEYAKPSLLTRVKERFKR